jgi:6,7-dimethyl-8-ribityllumazine synthase
VKKTGYAAPRRPARGEFKTLTVALLATRWNTPVVDALLAGARRALADWGVTAELIDEHRVAGAFELPFAARVLMGSRRYDGVIALGAVIRGDTPHFEVVAGEASRGLREASQHAGMPLGFGVLTVDNAAQAEARVGPGRDNKGYEAAVAMLESVRLMRDING